MPNQSSAPDLSLVLACYNESEILQQSLRSLHTWAKRASFKVELIFVDDKSSDDTLAILEKNLPALVRDGISCITVRHEINKGRGAAVRTGLSVATGRVQGFIDIDFEVPISYVDEAFAALEGKHRSFLSGKRNYFTDHLYAKLRHFFSAGYKTLARMRYGTKITDTEAGFKFFTADCARDIVTDTHENGWFWDTEVCLLAEARGWQITELPCLFHRRQDKTSKVNLLKDIPYYLKNLLITPPVRGAGAEKGSGYLPWIVTAAVVLGIYLRMANPYAIEFKFDEAETLNITKHYMTSNENLPWLGQRSSNGLTHPGFGLWPFILAGKYFGLDSPEGMSRVSQFFGVAQLFCLLSLAYWGFRGRSRRYFLYAICLLAVSPYWVLQERKGWHPALLGFFVASFLLAWRFRHRKVPAFFAGLLLLLPGQVHMSGFFFLCGFVGICVLGRLRQELDRIKLWAFSAGLAIGAIPLMPWLYLLATTPNPYPMSFKWERLLSFKYFNYWFSNSHGLLMKYPFGKDTSAFLQSYTILALAILAVIFVVLAPFHFRRLFSLKRFQRAFLSKTSSELSRWEFAFFWGIGIVSIASFMHIPRYFLLCSSMFSFITIIRSADHLMFWLRQSPAARRFVSVPMPSALVMFALILTSQAAFTYAAMEFINHRRTSIRGDFGHPYKLSKFPEFFDAEAQTRQNQEK